MATMDITVVAELVVVAQVQNTPALASLPLLPTLLPPSTPHEASPLLTPPLPLIALPCSTSNFVAY